MKKPLQFLRDAGIWLAALVVLVLGTFVLNLPLVLSLLLAVLVFGGLFFVLNPKSAVEESREALKDEVAQKLSDTRSQIALIRYYGRDVTKIPVRDHIAKICDLAEGILKDLAARPDTELATATRFNTTFTETREIVKLYTELAKGQVATTPEKRTELMTKIETDVLGQIETSLDEFAQKLDQGEIVSLEAAMRVLENTLKLEGIS